MKPGLLIFLFLTSLFLPPDVLPASLPVNHKAAVPCIGCHSSLRGKNYLQPERYERSVHGKLACTECHDPKRVRSIDSVHRESIGSSNSGRTAEKWEDVLRRKTPFPDALSACARCHPKIFTKVRKSVHGRALFEQGITEAAFCTDCHLEIHYLKPVTAVTSSVARRHLIETCSRCHANKVIASRYNLNVYVVQSYKSHFHGKKYSLGGKETPTCIFCHGHHSIRSVKDPASPVSPKNKVLLCARCHKGATPAFAASFTHTPLNAASNPLAFQIRRILVLLLAGIVLLLSVHIFLELVGQFRRRTPKVLPHVLPDVPWSLQRQLPKEMERMDLHLRIQHAILFVAIFYLGASGMALKFPEIPFSRGWIQIWGGVENAGNLHRFAALVLIIDVIYHFSYVGWRILRKGWKLSIVPRVDDFRLLFQNLRYLSGRSAALPSFDKYTYIQKLDYWLVMVVVLLMCVTGLVYWFPTVTARLLPRQSSWIWGVAYVIHSTEALLILFVAFVWHFYHVHLRSRVFPMSWIWITGRISLEEMAADHAAEFRKLVESQKAAQEVDPPSDGPPGDESAST
jgi:formate dehydrogenase subunit gamma